MVGTLFVCIRSYALIMTITFVELSIGLTLIGVKIVGEPDWPSPGSDAGEHVCGSTAFWVYWDCLDSPLACPCCAT